MIGDDGYWVLCSLEVLTPFFQGQNDCEEFSVVYVIISLGGREGV